MNTKRLSFKSLIVAALAVAIVAFTACQEEYVNEITNPTTKSGGLVIKLTDAPFPTDSVAEANVTISKIEIHEIDDQDEYSFITVSEEVQSFNLLDLTNGVTAILTDTAIEAGTYNQIRLYVDSASIVMNDSTVYDLTIPSGAQSGIKIKINPAVNIDSTSSEEILLDFDVSRSFIVQGNPNSPAGIRGFLFKPVIKASTPSTTGILRGNVTDAEDNPVGGVTVSVLAADTVYTSSFTEENGDYKIMGIEPGLIDVEFKKGEYSITREDVEITAGNTTKVNATLTSEN
ncbi:MAG TPA: DUF4382 domain-containing protein [Draconibacterium sp.]|nr:DUF4382 domain-containing protein [Draconibacterium sp.]